jgi:hypothetical protein
MYTAAAPPANSKLVVGRISTSMEKMLSARPESSRSAMNAIVQRENATESYKMCILLDAPL